MKTSREFLILAERYKSAQEDTSLRQPFLDGLDLEDSKKYVKGVFYMPLDEDDGKGLTAMAILPGKLTWAGFPFLKSTILVYPVAFSPGVHPRIQDFLSTLIDHEGFHARELYKPGWKRKDISDYFTSEFARHSCELDAKNNQIDNLAARDCSASFMDRTWNDAIIHNLAAARLE